MDYVGLHNVLRWITYVVCIFGVARALPAWLRGRDYTLFDTLLWLILALVMLVQALLGLLAFSRNLTFSAKTLEHILIGIIATSLPLMFSVWRSADKAKRFRILFVTSLVCLMLSIISVNVISR